jgi:hypothetical protein
MKKRSLVTESRLSVHVIKVQGAKFLTITPGSECWKGHDPWADGHDVEGVKFVRIQPPEDATDADVERLRAYCARDGVDVQVAQRPRAQVVVDQATVKYEEKGIRETVEKMVEEAVTNDRPALSLFVQSILSEVGL